MSWGTGLSAFASSFAIGYQLKQSRQESEKKQALMDTQNEAAKLGIEQSRERFPLELEQTRGAIDLNKANIASVTDSTRRENEMQPGRIAQQGATLDQTNVATANAIDANRRAEDLHGVAVDQANASVDATRAGTASTIASTEEQVTKNKLTRGALPGDNGLSGSTNDAFNAAFGPSSPTYVPINGGGGPAQPYDEIRQSEGFRSEPYRDNDGRLRIGYGSDTVTLPDGTKQPVTASSRVTREDAERDLARRAPEFQRDGIVQYVGADAWNRLPANAQEAITSLAYNYGSLAELPTLTSAIKSGDTEAIAKAIEARKGDNDGINANRRQREADIVRGAKGTAGTTVAAPAKSSMANAPTIDADQSQVAEGIKLGLQRLSGDLLGNDVGQGFALPPENADEAIQRLYLGDGAGEPELVTRVLNSVDPEGFYPTGPRVNMAIGAIMATGNLPIEAKAEAVKELLQSARMEAYRWATLAEKAADAGDIDGQLQAAIQAWNTIPDNEIVTAVDYDEKADKYNITLRDVKSGKERTQPFLSPKEVAAGALAIQPEMFDEELARFVATATTAPSGTNGKGTSATGAAALPIGPAFEQAARTGTLDPAALGSLPENLQPEYREAVTAGNKQLRGGASGDDAVASAQQVMADVVAKYTTGGTQNMQGPAPAEGWSKRPTSGSLAGVTALLQDPEYGAALTRNVATYLQRSDAVNSAVLTDLLAGVLVPGQQTWEMQQLDDGSVLFSNRKTSEKVTLPEALTKSLAELAAKAKQTEVDAWSNRSKAGADAINRNKRDVAARRAKEAIDARNAEARQKLGGVGVLPDIVPPRVDIPGPIRPDYSGGIGNDPLLERRALPLR